MWSGFFFAERATRLWRRRTAKRCSLWLHPRSIFYLLDVNMPRLSGIMAAAIGAVVLDIIGAKKGVDRLSLASRICAAASLVIGFINAIS